MRGHMHDEWFYTPGLLQKWEKILNQRIEHIDALEKARTNYITRHKDMSDFVPSYVPDTLREMVEENHDKSQ